MNPASNQILPCQIFLMIQHQIQSLLQEHLVRLQERPQGGGDADPDPESPFKWNSDPETMEKTKASDET